MSSLINDLNSIYEIKQQIKDVAYIESDIFAEYPAYIAEAIASGGATGYTTITANGSYNVATYQYAYVDVPQQEVPVVPPGYTYVDGYTAIIANGEYEIASYAYAYIDVPAPEGWVLPTGSAYITTNGQYDVHLYENAFVDVEGGEIDWAEVAAYGYVLPAGTYNVTENGTFTIGGYAYTYVAVPSGSIDWDEVASYGYIVPAGDALIVGNGTYDIASNAYAVVNVPIDWDEVATYGYIVPSGTTTIENNGTYTISQYAYVTVNVSGGGTTPTGNYYINQNGNYDISSYEFAYVTVPTGATTYAFSGGEAFEKYSFAPNPKELYKIKDSNDEEIIKVLTDTWWTYAFPGAGEALVDPAYDDPTHNIFVMNDTSYVSYWNIIDYDYSNLPDWNEYHLNKQSGSNYFKATVTFMPEYNISSTELVPWGMNRKANKFSYTGLCAYSGSWQSQKLTDVGANIPLKKDINVRNYEYPEYWKTSQKITYSGNNDVMAGSYISSLVGSSWNVILDGSRNVLDVISKGADSYINALKIANDDTYTSSGNNIVITGNITQDNYSDYIGKSAYFNVDTVYSYSSNYLYKFGFYPEFGSDIPSEATSYSTSKSVELYYGDSILDDSFSNITDYYSEFDIEYTLTVPNRWFMDSANNLATLQYTFTGVI